MSETEWVRIRKKEWEHVYYGLDEAHREYRASLATAEPLPDALDCCKPGCLCANKPDVEALREAAQDALALLRDVFVRCTTDDAVRGNAVIDRLARALDPKPEPEFDVEKARRIIREAQRGTGTVIVLAEAAEQLEAAIREREGK